MMCIPGIVLRQGCSILRVTRLRKVQRASWNREPGQRITGHASRRVLAPRSRVSRVRGRVDLVTRRVAGHWRVGCPALQLLHGCHSVVKIY